MFSLIQAILPIFKHFEENIVRWVGQLLDIIQVSNQYLEELKKRSLSYELSFYKNRNEALEIIPRPPILFTHLKPFLFISKSLQIL